MIFKFPFSNILAAASFSGAVNIKTKNPKGHLVFLSKKSAENNVAVGVFAVGVFHVPTQTMHPAEIHWS